MTIGELAAMFYCSERHARTLVQQLQDQGWLSWHSQPGRGKRARLHCLKTLDELRAAAATAAATGQPSGALEMAQLDPQHLQDLLSPHLGGQWQAGSPTLHSLLPHAGSARPTHADRPRRATSGIDPARRADAPDDR
ncbi:SgrR family transcriptional regulator [Serratia ureilytica]